MHHFSPLNQEFLLNGEARLMNVEIWCANCWLTTKALHCQHHYCMCESKQLFLPPKRALIRREEVVALPSFTRQKKCRNSWRANLSVIIGFERCVRPTDSSDGLSLNEPNQNYPTIHLQSDRGRGAYQFVNVSIPRMESVVPSK